MAIDNFFFRLLEQVFDLFESWRKKSSPSKSSNKTNDIISMDRVDDSTQLNKEIILNVKIKIYIKPKKSIHFLYAKKNQKIIILGSKTLNGIKWSKVKTENGNEGWCIL